MEAMRQVFQKAVLNHRVKGHYRWMAGCVVVLSLPLMPVVFANQDQLLAIAPTKMPELSAAQIQTLRQGKVLTHLQRTEASAGIITVIGLLPRTRSEVWQAMTHYPTFRKMYPKVLEGEVRSNHGLVQDHYMVLDYPWPLANRWCLTRTQKHPASFAYSWKRLAGDIKENDGFWRLYEFEGQTLIYYKVRLNPGLDLIPDRLIRLGMRVEAPEIVLNIRRYFKRLDQASAAAQ